MWFGYPSTAAELWIVEGRERIYTRGWWICSNDCCGKGVSVECACECVGGRQLIDTINVIRKPYQSIFHKTFQMASLETRKG